MSYVLYLIFRLLVVVFSVLPFWFLYGLSDIFAFILRYIVKYRLNVIRQNLKKSFPDKSDKELEKLIFPIYRNITDLTVETIKGFSLSRTKLKKHIYALNLELMHEIYDKYNGVIGVLGHYGNWEWAGLLAGLELKQKTIALYKPLSNKYLDEYFRKTRSRFGIELCSIYSTSTVFEKYAHQKTFFALVADQSPSNIKKAIWVKFLNQDTACLQGPEKYTRLLNLPVVYVHINRVSRGYYEITFDVLHETGQHLNENEITERYMKKLEAHIYNDPTQWLWSHRRWKHKKS